MKDGLTKFDYNGIGIEFEIRNGQVYANATAMCQANGKEIRHWLRLPSTQEYIDALEKQKYDSLDVRKSLIGDYQLVITRKGGSDRTIQGTWIHERLIADLARWISMDFRLWCDNIIAKVSRTGELLTHEQVLYLVELKEVFKYISHCEDAERMNHAAFVSKHKGGENPHAAFHRMRNTILEMKPEDVDARIKQYCLENSQRVPKSKRAKLEMLNPYEVLRNGVWDFLHGRGRMDALPLANLVRGMAEREGTAMFRRNQTDLFRQQQDVSIPQLA